MVVVLLLLLEVLPHILPFPSTCLPPRPVVREAWLVGSHSVVEVAGGARQPASGEVPVSSRMSFTRNVCKLWTIR